MVYKKPWDFRCSRRSGFILAEALLMVFIVSIAMAMTWPHLWDWHQERELDMAVEEVVAAIRQTETNARSYTTKYGNITSKVAFYCGPGSDGRVTYYAKRGIYRMGPKGTLPQNIKAQSVLDLTFRKDGYAGESKRYSQTLQTKDGRHYRTIIVAVYTGRVHIEK